VLAVCAGLAAGLAHPPWGVLPGLLGYGLMLWLADRADQTRPLRSAFWRGWLAGCGYFAVSLHWLVYPFYVDAANQAWMAPIAVVVVVAGIALFWGVALTLYRRFAGRGARRVLLFAGLLGAFEWLRGHVLTGFPWDLPGETWAAGSAPSQMASLVGAYGLSWITVATFSAAGVVGDRRGGKLALGVAAAALAGVYGFGAIRLAHPPPPAPKAPWIRLVQPDVPQYADYDRALFVRILEQYVKLTGAPAARPPDIVVWPEGAIPAALEDYLAPGSWTVREIARAVRPTTTLMIGGYRFAGDPSRPAIAYNSLIVARPVEDNLEIEALYDKFRLVPFGEYIPLDSLAGKLGIKELVHVGDGFASGPRPRPLTAPGVPAVQPLICYEVLFPGFTREGAAASGVRARWIVNVSTDAWFGPGAGPLQHFNIARYRAIEEGLPMARATPTGVSGMIDAFGRVAGGQILGEGARGVIDAPLPPALPPTPFSRWGDTAFWLMTLLSLAGAGIPAPLAGEGGPRGGSVEGSRQRRRPWFGTVSS
jgi:apolipoprotein N-acyltransferase